jgi:hypothetical protein
MNHILYNISIIMLLLGIILLTYYLTKANNKPDNSFCLKEANITNTQVEDAYKMRPSEIFHVMFNNPSLWQGYETVKVTNTIKK